MNRFVFCLFLLFITFSQAATADICERSWPIREALEAKIGKPCDAVELKDLFNVTQLDLRDLNVKYLVGTDFIGLTNLKYLNLDKNPWLTELPYDLFVHTPALEFLSIRFSGLVALDERIFSSLTNLKQVHLDGNYLEQIPVNLFRRNGQLIYVGLSQNLISEISENTFADLKRINEINLAENNIKFLPENLFFNQNDIKMLWLSSNRLSDLPDNIFQNCKKIEGLFLNNNPFSSLPRGLLKGLNSLKEVWLFDTQLSHLSEDFFWGLSSLEVLLLSHNRLENLSENAFNGHTPNLHMFQIFNSKIQKLSPAIFRDLKKLEILALDGRAITDEVLVSSSVRNILIGVNDMNKIPGHIFSQMPRLQEIYITGRSSNEDKAPITTLPSELLSGLPELKTVIISSTQIKAPPENLFEGISTIEEVYLPNNLISQLHLTFFDGMKNLKVISLKGNLLSKLNIDTYKNLTSLQKLDLRDNSFSDNEKLQIRRELSNIQIDF